MAFKMKNFEQISYSMINWMNSATRTLTDFTIGSKIRTLIETVAFELEEIYWRSYKSLSEAQAECVYTAFDFSKKAATQASGAVTMFRLTPDPASDHIVGVGSLVATDSTETTPAISFQVIESATLKTLSGISGEEHTYSNANKDTFGDVYINFDERFVSSIDTVVTSLTTFVDGVDYELYKDSSEIRDKIKWLDGGSKPAEGETFTVEYKPLSVDVNITCLETGIVGNVSSEKIENIMFGSFGIEYVKNFASFLTGTDEETVDERKERFSKFIEGLARGTIGAIKYAIFNKTETYTIHTALILENQPVPGFIKIYVADSTGTASDGMVTDVETAVEPYRGAGIVVNVDKPEVVLIDVYCKLRIKDGYNKDLIIEGVDQVLKDHLSEYKFFEDDGYYAVYLTNLDYVVKNVNPTGIIEADIAFKKETDTWDNISNKLQSPRKIDDIIPSATASSAEVFKAGNIEVSSY